VVTEAEVAVVLPLWHLPVAVTEAEELPRQRSPMGAAVVITVVSLMGAAEAVVL
jgi:hypothetical protein